MINKHYFLGACVICMITPHLVQGQVVDLESITSGYVDGNTTGSRGILWDETGGSGAGMFTSFMSLQNTGIERGINHDLKKPTFNESTGGATQDIRASEFAGGLWYDPVTKNNYYQFSIDVNQVDSRSQMSLDNIRIFSSSTPITAFDGAFVTSPNSFATKPTSDSALIWELDTSTHDNTALLPYKNGSGKYEASVYIPAALFATAIQENAYIYFYTQVGGYPGYSANDGPEEWAVNVNPGTLVPEPYEYGLAAVLGLLGLSVYERLRMRRSRLAA